ncbi:MAG TPA: DUF3267 domain-containing protein [Anaerolineales bacterium]|nr:DUF3267 domain-containing protein [Anaerolineales bacterium]
MTVTNQNDEGKKDLSISISQAYVYMLAFVVPLIGLLGVLFIWARGLVAFFTGLSGFARLSSAIPSLVIGVPLHELIHGLSWAYFGKKPLRDIKFGFQLATLTPYAHSKVPLPARAYRLGALMPALLLGVVPYLIGLTTGTGWFTIFGLLYIFAAGGDIVVYWLIRKVDRDSLVEDHPSRAGCYVLAGE